MQTLASFFGQPAQRGRNEVAKRLAVAAAHPSAHLVQVAEAKHVRVKDYDGIGVGHVQAVFDDGGADKNVKLLLHESHDQLLHLVAVHLAVAGGDSGIRNQSLQHSRHLAQVLDAVVDHIHLSAPADFVANGVPQALFVESNQVGVHRLSVGGRSRHDAQVARRHERKLQGARNRRGRQRQRVNVRFKRFKLVLRVDAELLLFVDDHQPEVLELQVFAQDSVGSDQNIDFPVLEILQHHLGLFGRPRPVEVVDPRGQSVQTFAKRAKVLKRQQRRRNQHRHLLAVGHSLEGGAHRDFSFTKAHVAANQAVHGDRRFHVCLDVGRGLHLVGRVFVGKRGFELVLQVAVGAECKTFGFAPLRIQLDQVKRDLFDAALGLALGVLPGR